MMIAKLTKTAAKKTKIRVTEWFGKKQIIPNGLKIQNGLFLFLVDNVVFFTFILFISNICIYRLRS